MTCNPSSSAREMRWTSSSLRGWRAGMCSSKASPAWRRPFSPGPWPAHWGSTSAGSSSPRTSCPRTSPAAASSISRAGPSGCRRVRSSASCSSQTRSTGPRPRPRRPCSRPCRATGTIDGETHALDPGFFVVATQNPIDQEGTYPLPEAQLDRFLLRVEVGYPSPDTELEVYRRFRSGDLPVNGAPPALAPVVDAAGARALRESLSAIHIEDGVLSYVQELIAATRAAPRLVWGASPRAGLALLRVGRAWAAMEGRDFVIPDDIKRMAHPVLTHRLLPTADAELDGWNARRVLDGLLEQVAVPR